MYAYFSLTFAVLYESLIIECYPARGYLISIAYCLFFHSSCLVNDLTDRK